MPKEVHSDVNEVALKAAQYTVAILSRLIREKGQASWVLAGGSSPILAYKIIADTYSDAVDWSKVVILMGDERCVGLDHDDSNWGQISKILFTGEKISASYQLVPRADLGAEEGARLYSQQIREKLTDEYGKLHIDLLWLGIGEDGHTLSLFPNHPSLENNTDIIIPVHNSPKPPADRISLSVNGAVEAKNIIIFAAGSNKKIALRQVEENPQSLPVGLLAERAETAGAEVLWLYDEAARS